MYQFRNETGVALILVFIILIGLCVIVSAFITMVNYEIRSAGAGLRNMQAFYIAEAGLAKARWALTTGEEAVGWGETNEPFGEGTYTVTTTDNGDDTCTISSSGYIPNATNPVAQRMVTESNIPISGGSTNLSLSATASASSEQGSHTADKSNDGNSVTKWKSDVKNGSWLKLDFGSSTTFDKIIYSGSKIDSYVIQYSNNDVTYTNVTNPVESPSGTVNFDSVSARYLGFNVNGNKPEINELESYNTAEEGPITLGQGEFSTSW